MIRVLNVPSLYTALYKTVEFCKDNENAEIEIIVPDKLSLFMEKFLFEKLNVVSSFNIKVSTLNRFAKKSIVIEKEKQISKSGSILLIHKILNDNFNKLEILTNKVYSFSYAEDIFQTITQLKASKISYEEMKSFSSEDIRLNNKIKDLALIYECYENEKAGLLDSSDLFLMSTLTVAKDKENKKLLFVGFDDFTAIQYSIIERLAFVAEVNIFNYKTKAENKHLYNTEVYSQLKNIAYINQLPFLEERCEVEKSELKNFLETNLYAFNKNKFVLNDEIVKVYAGNNIEDEIEFVARDIRYGILNGKSFKDFGVAVFNLENQENKIKEIFEKYEINYYLDAQKSIINSVFYKFLVSVLKYNLEGYNLSHLIDLINSPLFLLEKDKKRNIIQKLLSVNFRGKITNDLNLDIDEEIKEKLISYVSLLIFDKKESAYALIEKFKNLESILDYEAIINESTLFDLDSKILLTKSKDAIYNLFDEIVKFNPNVNLKEFLDIFTHIAGVVKINNLPLSLDCVKVVDANNFMEVFDSLYIIGVTYGNAPSLKYDCGIILDNEIEKLSFANKLSPSIAHINRLSKLRLFNSILMFDTELCLTYSNTKSDVIDELLNRIQVETDNGEISIEAITKFKFDKYIALSKWDYIEFLCKNNKNIEKNNENINNFNEKIIKNKNLINISENNLNIYNEFNNISSSTLENYFKCPMYCFLQNILKIQQRTESEILAFDIGNILHQIMFDYYNKNKQVGDLYDFCKREVFHYVENVERLKLNIDSPVLTNLIDEAMRVINAVNYIDNNSLFETNKNLIEFEFKNEKALKLKNVSIIGKVDRVDIFKDMFRIVDYKSGKADASLKELYFGNKLQLFLYACAMENVLNKKAVGSFYLPLHNNYRKEEDNPYALKGFYLAEDFVAKALDKRVEPGYKSDIVNLKINKQNDITKSIGYKELSLTDLNNLKAYSKIVSEQAVEEIKSGFIKPTPSDVNKPCEYCPYINVCLKNSNNVEYRKSSKVNLDSFKVVEDETV